RSEPFYFVPVVAYVRTRRRLWPLVGLVAGLILVVWDLWAAAGTFLSQYAVRNDFRLDFAAATVGIRDGYSRLYDLVAQKSAIDALGAGFNPQPFISPPPLAWLVTPLLLLPFGLALVLWTALLLMALGWTWYLLAPSGGRMVRAAHLLLLLGVFPVAFGVMVGQPGALVAAAVATTWWLIRRDHPVWAGLVLSVLVLKPQLALLVPVCLLVAGHTRTFGAWLVASVLIGLAALALLGPDGVARYRDVLAQTQTPAWDITRRYAISGPLGLGPILNVAQVVVVAVAIYAAWRHRNEGPELPMAAGIIGSLLVTPYLGFQDFVMLLVAGWLILRARGVSAWQVGLMVAGYALLQLVIVVEAIPILLAEALLLLSLLRPAPRHL
ncbi:MAG TPA: glycosyltransferase family 87 protein, partial [Candidatus Dormibacteraeota bacterium]|nr:glycosyltransferase family 87 protein [Candidatus Dormibacteraeota bacterium]